MPGHAVTVVSAPLRPSRLEVRLLRAPTERPVRSSFGTTRSRPCLQIRVEDAEGAFGRGEIRCNFPARGAEYRARPVETVVAHLLLGRIFADPCAVFAALERGLHVPALRTGEPGPSARVAADLDIAFRDLAARRAGLPPGRPLGGERRAGGRPGRTRPLAGGSIGPDLAIDRLPRGCGSVHPSHPAFPAARGLAACNPRSAIGRDTGERVGHGDGRERAGDAARSAGARAAPDRARLVRIVREAVSERRAIRLRGGFADGTPGPRATPIFRGSANRRFPATRCSSGRSLVGRLRRPRPRGRVAGRLARDPSRWQDPF